MVTPNPIVRSLALAVVLTLAACTAGATPAATTSPTTTPVSTVAPVTLTPTIREIPTREPTPFVATPVPTAPRADVAVLESGFSTRTGSTNVVAFAVVLRNPNPTHWVAARITVNVAFLGADGSVLASANENAGPIAPDTTFAVGNSAFPTAAPASIKVTVSTSQWQELDVKFGTFSFSGVKTTAGTFSTKTSGLIGSTFVQEPTLVKIVAVYRNAAGAVIGGGFTFADKIPTGQTVAFTVSTLVPLTVVKTDVYGLL